MNFSHPWNLLLLILPAILLIANRRKPAIHKHNKVQSISFSSLSSIKSAGTSLRHKLLPLPYILIITSLILIIMAIAGPQYGVEKAMGKRNGIAIEMLFDISSSMDITLDSAGTNFNRMTAAKKVCKDFILGNNNISGRQDDVLGLITFARYADTASPMTTSLTALSTIVDELEVEDRPNEDGTAFGDALILAAAHLMKFENSGHNQDTIKSKIIILLTDGDNNCGKHLPEQAAALAKKWNIKIYAVFLGEKSRYTETKPAQPTESQKQLIKICEQTGGICRMVDDYDSLKAVYNEIDALEKSKINMFTDTIYREIFPWFTLGAFICLIFSIILNATILRRTP